MHKLWAAGVAVISASAMLAAPTTPEADPPARVAAAQPSPPRRFTADRMRRRPDAVRRGSVVKPADLFTPRVFANGSAGFALASVGNAQYPARTVDGGRTWRIDGPQLHIDAADGPEGVGYVGIAGPRTFFAYGSSVVDVTTDGGRTWWETLLGELVVAVVPGPDNGLLAYVQQQLDPNSNRTAATWQYVSHDGGRHWAYSSALGGL